jgi:hypothetical protein
VSDDKQKYEERKRKESERQAAQSAAGRDIGSIPKPAKPKRRKKCEKSLKDFCETYLPEWFHLEWSKVHLTALTRLESAGLSGGQFCFAMPRGSGKTTLCIATALWAVLYGHRSFVVMLGATESAADELAASWKAEIEGNDLLLEDFPEACYPVRCLEGINHRASAQTCGGERTHLDWGGKIAKLATIPGAKCSGAVLRTAGITGRIRGMSVTSGRKKLRPDLVLIDDPQTDESAGSASQNAEREKVLTGAVLGLAGPRRKIAAVMPCTVISPGDLADRILDRDRNPQWHGERSKMVLSFPSNEELWEEYYRLRAEDMRAGGDGSAGTEFYDRNRSAMDQGAEVYWESRYDPGELSALQNAMNLKQDRPKVFYAEYQNEPLAETEFIDSRLTAEMVANKVVGLPRQTVPKDCTRLTCGIDVGGKVLWYTLVAWDERFGGVVVDYGCWPRQTRAYFAAAQASPTLDDLYPDLSETARVYAGLRDLTAAILSPEYRQEETGAGFRVERCLIDSGWQTDTVYQFCRETAFASIVTPSKGYAVTTGTPISAWPKKPGERSGWNWRFLRPLLTFDPNPWKTQLATAWRAPNGTAGRLALHGTSPVPHQLYAAHVAAETPTKIAARGREFEAWARRPNEDNHWLDTTVLAAVGASFAGVQWSASGVVTPTPDRKPIKLSELQKQKQQQQGARR